jgi:hypothetical protein
LSVSISWRSRRSSSWMAARLKAQRLGLQRCSLKSNTRRHWQAADWGVACWRGVG